LLREVALIESVKTDAGIKPNEVECLLGGRDSKGDGVVGFFFFFTSLTHAA
jgi:hypothetical protein